jgi:hypothetical protein
MGRTLVSSDSEERPVGVEMDSAPMGSDPAVRLVRVEVGCDPVSSNPEVMPVRVDVGNDPASSAPETIPVLSKSVSESVTHIGMEAGGVDDCRKSASRPELWVSGSNVLGWDPVSCDPEETPVRADRDSGPVSNPEEAPVRSDLVSESVDSSVVMGTPPMGVLLSTVERLRRKWPSMPSGGNGRSTRLPQTMGSTLSRSHSGSAWPWTHYPTFFPAGVGPSTKMRRHERPLYTSRSASSKWSWTG